MRRSFSGWFGGLAVLVFVFEIAVRSILNSKELVLRFSRKMKAVAAGAVAAVAVLTVGVSAASAVPAVWSSPGTERPVGGELTITSGGYSATCFVGGPHTTANGGSPLQGGLVGGHTAMSPCTSGNHFRLPMNARANKSGSVFSLANTPPTNLVPAPFGIPGNQTFYNPAPYTVGFTNGSVSTPSKVVFSNTQIGTFYGSPVRATGTLSVMLPGGGLLTLQ